ncbi:PEGA domain-containing protein [Sandaracinus amylolyticus]|nr:PEGA domain-containing protein [Sandaracinus amylolyticus]
MRSLSRTTLGALVVALVALALGIASPRAAAQDDRERARVEFQRGVDAYGRADYQVALEAFQEAYRLAPHPMVRVNIANAYEQLDRPLEALFHFERFLAESTGASREQRREVDAAVRRLRQRVGELDLHVTPDGAVVTIDGTEQRRAPIAEPVRVVAGDHTIDIQLDGYRAERRTVTVAGGQTARVDVRLARAEAVVASGVGASPVEATGTEAEPVVASTEPEPVVEPIAEPEPTPPPSSGGGFRILEGVWVAGAITIAAGIAAGVTGGLALAANDDFERHVATYEDTSLPEAVREQARVDGREAADSASTLAVVTDALLITTILAAGTTAFLLITTQEGGMLADEETDVAVVPMVGESVAGAMVLGSF